MQLIAADQSQQGGVGLELVDRQRRFFEQILLVLFAAYLLVDSVNGFAMIVLQLPSLLSPVYKLGLLSLVLLYAYRYHRQVCVWCCLCLSLVLVWALLRFFLVDQTGAFYAIQESLKLLYFFVVLLVFTSFKYLTTRTIGRLLLFVVAIILLNVISTYLGYGEKNYGVFGAKGYFYSGNILSGILVICASYFLARYHKRSLFKFVLISGFFCLLSLLIGTKGGILGVVLATLIIMMLNLNAKGLLLIILIATGLSALVYAFFEVISSSLLLERILYFYKTGGWYYALFSGRDVFIASLAPIMLDADLLQWLFGLHSNTLIEAKQTGVELDWFDMQVYFGLLLTLIAFWGYAITLCRLLLTPGDELTLACIVSFILLSFISIIAGHITFNGMVTPLWGLFCGAALNQYRQLNDRAINAWR